MAVCDANWHASFLSQAQDVPGIVVDMTVDNIVGTMLQQDMLEVSGVERWPMWMETRNNLGPECADLFVVGSKSGRAEYPWYGC